MTLTLGNDEFNTLAEIIAKKVAESIKGCVPEKTSKAVKEVKAEVVKEEPKKEVKEEVVKEETKKEEEPLYKQEDIRKAVMAFTRESPDNLAKTKGILSELGLTQLTQLKGELITQFTEKFRAAGGKL